MHILIDIAGILTLVFLGTIGICHLYIYMKKLFLKQKRIRCLCKHYYEKYCTYGYKDYEQIILKCRKCGKTKKIVVWKPEDELEES